MDSLVYACVYFLATHFVIAGTPLRAAIVERLGEKVYMATFFLVAGLGLVWMIVAYGTAERVELFRLPAALHYVFVAINLVAAIFIIAGLTVKNPTAIGQDKLLGGSDPARGFLRITRHPMNTGFALFALAHLLENGDSASLVLFGSLFTLAALGPTGIDARRAAAHGEAWRKFTAKSSYIPFAAILAGRNNLELAELGWWRIVLGVLLFVAFFVVHGQISGVPLG